MLKFFRKIRRMLLDQSNPKKYLIYALGEILLVVIGILIALQINTWNSNANDRKNERYYLNQLLLELEHDSKTLQNEKDQLQNQLPAIEALLAVLHQDSFSMNDFNESVSRFINTCWYAMKFNSNAATFEEMKSSGKLGLIQDKALRNSIVVLYGNLSNLEAFFSEVNVFKRPQVVDISLNKGLGKYLDFQKATFSKYNSPENLYEMRKFKEAIINQALAQNWDVFEMTPVIDEHMEEIQVVAAQIRDYLK